MATSQLYNEDLLDPISAEQPAGIDLRWTPEWDRVKEARRSDDSLDPGKWTKKERKSADWFSTQEITTALLRERSKDLQLALWLTEAGIKLHGFAGLRDGLKITRELLIRYWDKGLYPRLEEGPEDRSGPFEWLNDKVVDSIAAIPLLAGGDSEQRYSLLDYQEARRVGSEASCKADNGEFDPVRKRTYDQALASGRVSMEMFEDAIRGTKRADFEVLNSDFLQARSEFTGLEKVLDEKFGEAAPNLSSCRRSLHEISEAVTYILAKLRAAEPDQKADPAKHDVEDSTRQFTNAESASMQPRGSTFVLRFPPSSLQDADAAPGSSWAQAEEFVRSGDIEKGLAEMMRLAAGETTGRSRFKRKLLLAEVCLSSKRERLARSILEELAEQIDKFQLEFWESSELISSVWGRLYEIYKRADEPAESERAEKLYQRLSRLDPWQALVCNEG
jgi:type VI secretion system protein ImpA